MSDLLLKHDVGCPYKGRNAIALNTSDESLKSYAWLDRRHTDNLYCFANLNDLDKLPGRYEAYIDAECGQCGWFSREGDEPIADLRNHCARCPDCFAQIEPDSRDDD